MISFGLWVAGLLGKQVTERQAHRLGLLVAIPLLVLALVLLVWGGVKLHDRGVIKQHEDAQAAEAANATLEADRDANANAQARANVAEAENQRLENAMAEAKQADPAKGQGTVGPVQQSYFDNLPARKR